jgi:ubiquinone/menaquinone biosynthesis C-methylase UbiE
MKLGWLERQAMNNPVRRLFQQALEGRQLLRLGGRRPAARALEIGCGSGAGIDLLFDLFNVCRTDGFDLDPVMLKTAMRRHRQNPRVNVWLGNTRHIPVVDATYDAVFDFGTLHHVLNWQAGLAEVFRVLKPGGRFYIEEITRQFITHPFWRRVLDHPQQNRFDMNDLTGALSQQGFTVRQRQVRFGLFIWVIADKPF